MSWEIVNKLRGFSTITVVDSTATINLSQLSANTNTENIVSAIITDVKWSLPQGGVLKITRDAGGGPNVVANLAYGDFWSHDELNIANTPTGNLVIAITGGGTAILSVKKTATYNVDTQQL